MTGDLTQKQESAALAFLECGDKSEAYRRAYDTANMKPETINRAAFELFEHPKVSARVKELQAIHRKRHEVTVDSITKELEEARTQALKARQPSAAVSASLGKAKIHGLIEEKMKVVKTLEDMSDDELVALARSKGIIS